MPSALVVLAPHLIWLLQNDFAPFAYAMDVHGDKPFAETARSALGYLAGSFGYVAVPVIVAAGRGAADRAALADMIWPADTDRRLAAAAFWAPLLLPVVGALASGTDITSLWSMSAWTLLPVLLLSPPAMTISSVDTRRLLAFAVALPLAMLIASPADLCSPVHAAAAPVAAQYR